MWCLSMRTHLGYEFLLSLTLTLGDPLGPVFLFIGCAKEKIAQVLTLDEIWRALSG